MTENLMNCLETELSGVMKPTDEAVQTDTIHRLRNTLEDVEPPIWRLFEVLAG